MQVEKQANPLNKYFRLPGTHIHLPTEGKFNTEGSIEFLQDGTVAVLPMRAADEMLMKNPDALMSGFAIEKLIESCVPAVKAPRQISSPDLDVILLAIRAATYGDTMEIQAVCPKCRHENTFDCNLGLILQNVTTVPEENFVRLTDDLVVYIRPYTLENTTELSLVSFEEARKIQNLELNEDITPDIKTREINSSMEKLTNVASSLMSRCIVKIVTPDAEVTDPAFIAEFFDNIQKTWTTKIEEKLTELNNAGIDKTVHVKCERVTCGNEWTTTVEFDPSTFFDSGS